MDTRNPSREGSTALRVDNDVVKAEDLVRQSIAIARKQGALAWELRAALALSELRARRGRAEDGLTVLRVICDRFTEGIETADMAIVCLERVIMNFSDIRFVAQVSGCCTAPK